MIKPSLIVTGIVVTLSMVTVQPVDGMFGTVGKGGGMFGGSGDGDGKGMFGGSGGNMFGGGNQQQEPYRYSSPPQCTFHTHHAFCYAENVEDARNLQKEIPNAIVRIEDDDDDEEDEEEDEEEREDEENNNEENAVTEEPQALSTPPSGGNADGTGDNGQGLVDLCLQQGLSQQRCNNYLFSSNPGGACQSAEAGGGTCGPVQDPSETFANPGQAEAESNRNILQGENALQGFNADTQRRQAESQGLKQLFPPGDLGSQFAGPGSTTNR